MDKKEKIKLISLATPIFNHKEKTEKIVRKVQGNTRKYPRAERYALSDWKDLLRIMIRKRTSTKACHHELSPL